jgi:membrane protease YdiL (CAAX protease family)
MKQQAPGYSAELYRDAVQYEKKSLRWESNRLCLVLLGIQALVALLTLLSRAYLSRMGLIGLPLDAFQGVPPVLYFLSYSSVYLIGMALPVFLYFGIRHISPSRALLFDRIQWSNALPMILFGIGVCTVANIPSNMVASFQRSMGYSGKLPELPLNEQLPVQVLFFITMAVIPPLVEELIFRGAILHGLRQFGDGIAILSSAFLFALYHGNFTQMVFAFPCGLVLAFAVIKTGSLWVSILIHFVNNATSVLFQLSQYYTDEKTASVAYAVYFFGSAILGVVALIVLSRRDKTLFDLNNRSSFLTTGKKFLTTLWNPCAVALLVVSLVSAFYILGNY